MVSGNASAVVMTRIQVMNNEGAMAVRVRRKIDSRDNMKGKLIGSGQPTGHWGRVQEWEGLKMF